MKKNTLSLVFLIIFFLLGPVPGQAQAISPNFPRLGMWWPDPWNQPLAAIARYDWVILGEWNSAFIGPLKAIHPQMQLLNSTNGCELSFNPDAGADPEENREVRAVASQWFLTQVGTTLTAAVNATTTEFKVAAVSATAGTTTIDLFVTNEAVLIEGESAWVTAVDKARKTLTVRRGYVRPAASHPAGVRLAAHITFWPGSWLLNLSSQCPLGLARDGSSTPEIWADYNAGKAITLVQSGAWDGILLDRTDTDQSWLIGNSTARSIDPDQSNRLLTDYSGFDTAWNNGIRRYEQAIRTGVGPDKIVFSNLGMANFDLLNGNNFEGYPKADGDMTAWRQLVFGPLSGQTAGYGDWALHGRSPNITMVETYQDDSGPNPSGSGAYDNPCTQPGFVPDYRKMRFGLSTTLLNDGYFSYEINTNGHGSLCLMWFDEYDNAGKGRGYLGQPAGAAYRALGPLTAANLLPDASFETSLGGWNLWFDSGYAASVSRDSQTAAAGVASARIDVSQSQGTDWQVSFSHGTLPVISGKSYTLSFWAKADRAGRSLSSWVQQSDDPWRQYVNFGAVQLGTDWRYYELSATTDGSNSAAELLFGLGQAIGTVWLDDIRLQNGSRQVWRRDYERGTIVVNATSVAQIVPLGAAFRKIQGHQDPVNNDGRLVQTVTIPPFDGLILLKETGPKPSVLLPPLLLPLLLDE
ncbi:MAG: carbohydrate binding domain-containing protein [Desulfoprunum sp.]|nr:carbohydrate binding domain-containing protein [Desulfoprunum sp.]